MKRIFEEVLFDMIDQDQDLLAGIEAFVPDALDIYHYEGKMVCCDQHGSPMHHIEVQCDGEEELVDERVRILIHPESKLKEVAETILEFCKEIGIRDVKIVKVEF